MRFNNEEMGSFSTASLITRTTNDITQVQTIVVLGLQAIIKAPILLVWAIVKISGKQWQWSVATARAVITIIMAVLIAAIVLALPKFQIIQTLTDNLNRVTKENLNGIRVVRAYNAEGYQNRKFENANEELTGTNLFANRVMALLMPTMTFVSSGISLAIYWIGAYLINAADMTERLGIFSDMVVFSSYAMQIIMAFTKLSMMFIMLPRVLVSARRINEVLDTDVHMKDGTADQGLKGQTGCVEFRDVSFRYPGAGEDVLHHISFTAGKGETVAIIGATASGKSSLVNLIPRFYDTESGEVLVDGVNVRDYDSAALREKIGYVSQHAVLFSGTVASNVAYGKKDCDETSVSAAIDTAQGTEFVGKMPHTIHASVAQGSCHEITGSIFMMNIKQQIERKNQEIFRLIFDQ